jgi:nitrilase
MLLGCFVASQSYAIESQSFVLHCTGVLTEGGIEQLGTAGAPVNMFHRTQHY